MDGRTGGQTDGYEEVNSLFCNDANAPKTKYCFSNKKIIALTELFFGVL